MSVEAILLGQSRHERRYRIVDCMCVLFALSISALCCNAQADATFIKPGGGETPGTPKTACAALQVLTGVDFTIESAIVVPAQDSTPEFCRVMGQILPEIR